MLKYGWHGADALIACVEDEVRQDALKEYMADMLCLIARPHYKSNISMFSELYKEVETNSNKTADEIFDGVLAKLDKYADKKLKKKHKKKGA